MIELPPALAPWARELTLFPAELAHSLGQAAARLSHLLGPWPHRHHLRGEPDGYDGVARRGSYERLLATEWLLLDELPDEFLRRVASHEHAFLATAFRERTGGRHCTVLFDAGPEQLGAPRIAHLALLIALAQRAAAANATLEWAVLEPGPLTWCSQVSKHNVLELVQRRFSRALPPESLAHHLAEARARVGAAPAHELWLVGGDTATARAAQRGANTIAVRDLAEPERPRQLTVEVALAARHERRHATLELPADRLAVQLLRDPFAVATAPHVRTAALEPRSDLLFAADDRRLYALTVEGALASIPVPNSSRGGRGAATVFAPPHGGRVVAVGRASSNRTLALCDRPDGLVAYVLSKRGASAFRMRYYTALDKERAAGWAAPKLRSLAVYGDDRLYFLGDTRAVFEVSRGAVAQLPGQVAAFVGGASCMYWVDRDDSKLCWNAHVGAILPDHVAVPTERFELTHGRLIRVLISRARLPLVARERVDGWQLFCERRPAQEIDVARTDTVHGILDDPRGAPSLLVLDESRQRVLSVGERTEVLCTAAAPLTTVAANHRGTVVAMLDQRGAVTLYSLAERKILMRSSGSEET